MSSQHDKYEVLLIQPSAHKVGGIDSLLLQVIRGLSGKGFHFTVVTPQGNRLLDSYREANAAIVTMELSVFFRNLSPAWVLPNIRHFIPAWKSLHKLVRSNHFDIIHSHKLEFVLGDIVGSRLGVRTVHHVHENARNYRWAYCAFGRSIEPLADKVLVQCDAAATMFSKKARKSGKVVRIHNGIDLARYTPTDRGAAKRAIGFSSDKPLVGTVVRLSPTKGLETFIDAAADLASHNTELQFVIFGDVAYESEAAYRESLQERIKRRGLSGRMRMPGLTRNAPLALAAMDVFVHPAVWDVLPQAVLEAMAMEVPVVASNVGGVPEQVVDGVTGILVPPKDPGAIVRAVEKLLSDPGVGEKMGIAGRRRVEQEFTVARYLDGVEAAYRSVLGS